MMLSYRRFFYNMVEESRAHIPNEPFKGVKVPLDPVDGSNSHWQEDELLAKYDPNVDLSELRICIFDRLAQEFWCKFNGDCDLSEIMSQVIKELPNEGMKTVLGLAPDANKAEFYEKILSFVSSARRAQLGVNEDTKKIKKIVIGCQFFRDFIGALIDERLKDANGLSSL